MSMPSIPKPDACLTKDQSLHMILASIAMEEVALSHILNAEGEKIQFALACAEQSCDEEAFCRVLEVNDSASEVIGRITDMQLILKEKMRQAIASLPDEPRPIPPACGGTGAYPPYPPCPPYPPKPPKPPRPPVPPYPPHPPVPPRPPHPPYPPYPPHLQKPPYPVYPPYNPCPPHYLQQQPQPFLCYCEPAASCYAPPCDTGEYGAYGGFA
ncbi:MAG: hypothetical protein LBC83_06380 [Oscillospiraceae bacterium]|nr:hypothetical protein [Oscillospiraceae bacterium]